MSAFEWIRSRPAAIQALMLQLPPACRVHANRPLMCPAPAPGRVGRVVSYLEGGRVGVMDEGDYFADRPDADRAVCLPAWLEVVQYDGNKTPEWVQRVIDGEDIEPANPGAAGRIEGDRP